MQKITLYADARLTSPYAMSVFVALTEKRLDFTLHTVDLDRAEQHAGSFAAQSLTQRVPLLVHGDFMLSESSAITEYLDAMFPDALLYPQAPRERARARQVQAWLRSDLMPIRHERSTETLFYQRTDAPLSDAARAAAHKLYAAADALLPQGEEHLFGEWSIADVDLAVMLNRLVLNGDDAPARLVAYAERQWARPSVQRWVELPRAKD